jgi:phosphatidate phosphatase APP1
MSFGKLVPREGPPPPGARDWKRLLARAIVRVERPLDAAIFRWKLARGALDPLCIIAYRGFGNDRALFVRARVLERFGFGALRGGPTLSQTVLHSVRRFSTDEVPGAVVRVEYGGRSFEATGDEEGYVELELPADGPPAGGGVWRDVTLELVRPKAPGQGRVLATAPVLVPPPAARFGVVSDVDDTVVRSHAYRFVRHARAMLFEEPAGREAFAGAAALYRALAAGPSGRPQNPVFYVSSSPTNVYDLFEEILEVHGFPAGPIFLKDFGVSEDTLFKAEHGAHKRKVIGRVLATYPELPFVLFGDSGQEDAEIYRDLTRTHPGRIAAVFLRDVRPRRREAVEAVAAEVRAAGVGMWLVRDSAEASAHARRLGFVTDAEADVVRREVERAGAHSGHAGA